MKQSIKQLSSLCLAMAFTSIGTAAYADDNQPSATRRSNVGVGVQFGNSTSFGVESNVSLGSGISVRPAVYFGYKPGAENAAITNGNGINIPFVGFGTPIPAGTLKNEGTGALYSLAVTYDFPLDAQGRSSGYIGPKVSTASASNIVTFGGREVGNLDVRETKIGLTAGADFEVTDGLTLGANLTYNFSRSTSASFNSGSVPGNLIRSSGSDLDFGIKASYRF